MSLERFHQAQAGQGAGYTTALAEIRRGRKSGHWIWYVFPQLDGLGHSSMARAYALRDLDEDCCYLRDPVLGARYEEIVASVAEQLTSGVLVEHLMGGSTDALKLASSLTLFRAAAARLAETEAAVEFNRLARLCDAALHQTTAHGYGACGFTIERCGSSPK